MARVIETNLTEEDKRIENNIIQNILLVETILYKIYLCTRRVASEKKQFCQKGSGQMVFNTGAALLDAIVLAVVSREEQGLSLIHICRSPFFLLSVIVSCPNICFKSFIPP